MEKKPRTNKKETLALFSVILIDVIGFAILVPILPDYAKNFGIETKIYGLTYGLLVSSYACMQFIFAPLWGRLSDKIGRKKVISITLIGSSLAMLLLGFSESLTMLFISRMLGGAFAGNLSVAVAYLTDLSSKEDRTKTMGLVGVAFGIGFIIGPGLAGLLASLASFLDFFSNPSLAPIFFTAFLTLLNAGYANKVLSDTHSEKSNRKRFSFGEILKHRVLISLCLANFLFVFAINQLEVTFALYMDVIFGFGPIDLAWIFTLMALTTAFIQGGAIRKLSKKYSDLSLLLSGSALLIIGFLWLPIPTSVNILLIPILILSVGRSLSQPTLSSMSSKLFSAEQAGTVMGIFTASGSLGRCIGPLAGGQLFDMNPAYPYRLSALLVILMLSTLFIIRAKASIGPKS